MIKKPIIAFIDDDQAELDRFEAAMGSTYQVFTALGLAQCQEKLRNQGIAHPDLWVLDLFFPREGAMTTPGDRAEMNTRYVCLNKSVQEYRGYLASIGQGPEGGKALLKRCKASGRPVVMFTRKGALDDAIECREQGAQDVLKKPMPAVKADWPIDANQQKALFDEAMQAAAPQLQDHFNRIINANSFWMRYKPTIYAIVAFVLASALHVIFEKQIHRLETVLFSQLWTDSCVSPLATSEYGLPGRHAVAIRLAAEQHPGHGLAFARRGHST